MENLYQLLADAVAEGQAVALATVVHVEGSTPRGVGAKMLVYADGHIAGTVGGGKMEALVIQEARTAIEQGESRLSRYQLHDAQEGDPGICGGTAQVFIDVVASRPTLLIVGAGHVAMPVAAIGQQCGFRVVVVDDRPDMLSEDRFPDADRRIAGGIVETLQTFPITAGTYIVIVTRGHAYDEDALRTVIDSPASYVGMIGSRRKVQTVLDHLRAGGNTEEAIRKVHAPIGLDLGGQTPAEIAVSILAEIQMVRYQRTGQPMKLS